ncbi:DNA-directed DNA polymerase III PolC [Terriglobus roseus DSM 18391]|uniref:Error-prone DNA polymerase n=1 Tax=Terriglobus roseus (strain DSM 18391 / NRRL B-41598 / KBS 63) TaxID=926566 RepID=I3ZFG8_TERRK|nr:error-prone DNA polymerase [Terriglobus roseus]AFL87986.1 DNA-directed DNA polymerase III PolC [Terriglobus roseus DSM 18391]
MTDSDYVELHANSAFSFLEGASQPEHLIDVAEQMQMPAMALMDRNGLYGAARFHLRAKEKGIRAHIGAEVAADCFDPRPQPPLWLPHQQGHQHARLPLLCSSQTGYNNLCQLITRFKLRERGKAEGFAHERDLEEFAEGLVCLTGGDEGPLAAALTHGGVEEGRKLLDKLQRIYGRDNVYVEVQRHGEREEEWRNAAASSLAESLRLPILATNGVRYSARYDREILDVFTCIRNGVDLEHAGRLLQSNSQRHVRNGKEMRQIFADLPRAIENTSELSQRLDFELDKNFGYAFPSYPVPDGETMDSYLRKRVREDILNRYYFKWNSALLRKAKRQAETELRLIEQLGFAGYFLIVWDIVRYCGQNDILVQGRGSAANSVVCYALGITAVDPVSMGLLFERFLNENRREYPDIDLDLPSGDKRESAIKYVYQRYGELGAAMTANVITYRGKSAAREVGKALGFDEETAGRLSSLVGQWEWRRKDETLSDNFRHAGFDLQHRRIAKYVELSERLQDLPRHLGQHSGGMVICQGALNKVVPLERASMPGRTVVQWDKDDCSQMGMVKVDLLGLGMMAVMKDCLDLIPAHYGDVVDLAHLPQDDDVYDVLQKADTVGMFQVESRAQMASLPRNKPKVFYDIVVQVAIIRPGPIVGKMMHPYMRRRQGLEEAKAIVPELDETLRRTLGVPLFQEQLLRMAMVVGEFSGAEAEELRKAVGMRRSRERMAVLMAKLRDGMIRKGYSEEIQNDIVQSIESFALYGFPESHAASFALIAYASAYFKVKYLAAFLCAMLNNQPMGFYTPAVLVKDAQRHGLRVRPMDVQVSQRLCTVEHDEQGALSVRMGLMYVRGLHTRVADALVAERERAGIFRGAEDLARRVPSLNRRDMAQLARVGALNWMDGVQHRRDAIWQAEQCSRPAGPLLRDAETDEIVSTASPLKQMTDEERLVADYSGAGLTTGRHPMAFRRAEMRRAGILSATDLRNAQDGAWVRAAGAIIARQRPGTALGFIFLSMEDETGIANVIIHPELYERDRALITRGKFLHVEGKLQNQDGVVHVKAERVKLLEMSSADIRSHDFH